MQMYAWWLCCLPHRSTNTCDAQTQTNHVGVICRENQCKSENKMNGSLDTAMQLVKRAIAMDRDHNYEEALSLYQHSLVYFMETLNYGGSNGILKSKILSKCRQYIERAEIISEHLNSARTPTSEQSYPVSVISRSMTSLLVPVEAFKNKTTKQSIKKIYQSFKTNTNNKENGEKVQTSNSAKE